MNARTPPGAGVQDDLPGMPTRPYVASPSKLLAFLDCPLRFRMQYLQRPMPTRRPQRAHTSMGQAIHNALRDWWDLPLPDRTPEGGAALLRAAWIRLGFRDQAQSEVWRERAAEELVGYLGGVDPRALPLGNERSLAFRSGDLVVQGRIDRLDDRAGALVIVDYKTSRRRLHPDDARTSLPLALYAAAAWKVFKRRCVRVELHHTPTGEVIAHEHTPESLTRKVEQARSLAMDARRAEEDWARRGEESASFPARTGPLCRWCDFRAHCPAGQAEGPEKSDWAALEDEVVPLAAEFD